MNLFSELILMSDSWVVDQEYLAVLERKLKVLKDPKKTTAKQVVSDIAARKEHQVGPGIWFTVKHWNTFHRKYPLCAECIPLGFLLISVCSF